MQGQHVGFRQQIRGRDVDVRTLIDTYLAQSPPDITSPPLYDSVKTWGNVPESTDLRNPTFSSDGTKLVVQQSTFRDGVSASTTGGRHVSRVEEPFEDGLAVGPTPPRASLRPRIASCDGASGVWQVMVPTCRTRRSRRQARRSRTADRPVMVLDGAGLLLVEHRRSQRLAPDPEGGPPSRGPDGREPRVLGPAAGPRVAGVVMPGRRVLPPRTSFGVRQQPSLVGGDRPAAVLCLALRIQGDAGRGEPHDQDQHRTHRDGGSTDPPGLRRRGLSLPAG